jgi:hypothetical protein
MFAFLKNILGHDNTSWKAIIPILEKGDEAELKTLLWKSNNKPIQFLPITITMVQRLSKPDGIKERLVVHDVWRQGKFILVIFQVPWDKDDFKYSPLIIDTRNNKVAGKMLPFNELHGILTNAESNQIGELGAKWALWAFKMQFDE